MRLATIAILTTIYLFAGVPEWMSAEDTPATLQALSYSLFHANIFHLAANCLSIWFVFHPKRKDNAERLTEGLAIAMVVYLLAHRPIVGFSNVLFAVCGLRTPSFRHPWWRSQNTIIFLAVTLLMGFFPQFSTVTHILSFLIGATVAAIDRYVTGHKGNR